MSPRLDLGLGMVTFPGMIEHFDHFEGRLDCLEVEPQTLWLPTSDASDPWRPDEQAMTEIVATGLPVLAHGVSAPVGSSQPPDDTTVAAFARSVTALGAIGASEHLSFNAAGEGEGRIDTGLFLPPCPTSTGVARCIEAVLVHQRQLGGPFSIETGVNYLQPRRGELPDSEIVARVATGADCGILLDLHNLWCNERNGRERVWEAIARLPLERVTEVHLAGGVDLHGYRLDGHCDLVPAELLTLAADVLPMLPNVRAVIFEMLPLHVGMVGLARLRAHLDELAALVHRARHTPLRQAPARPERNRARLNITPEAWESSLAAAATGWPVDRSAPVLHDPATRLLRTLVDAGRAGRVVRGAPATFELLRSRLDRKRLDDVMASYTVSRPPALWGLDETERFLLWAVDTMEMRGLQAAVTADLGALDEARSARPATTAA